MSEIHELRAAILGMLGTASKERGTVQKVDTDMLAGTLESITDIALLRVIHELAQYSTTTHAQSGNINRCAVMNNMDQNGCKALLSAHANLDSIKDSSITIRDFIYARTFLAAYGITEDAQGHLPTVAAHLYAKEHYNDFAHAMIHSYIYNLDSVYVGAVEKHAKHVEALVKYRNERGDRTFNEKDFQQYLKLGVISGGWL